MRFLKILVAILFLNVLLFSGVRAQDATRDDFGLWTDVQLNKAWSNGLYVGFRAEFRTCDLSRKVDCLFLRPSFGYQPLKWLKVDIGYDYLVWADRRMRHSFLVSVTGTLKREHLTVSLRERYMLMYMQNEKQFSHVIRSFLKVQYQIGESRFAPFLSLEMFTWRKWQMQDNIVGTSIHLSKHCDMEIFYNFNVRMAKTKDSEPVDYLATEHIAGVGVTVNL